MTRILRKLYFRSLVELYLLTLILWNPLWFGCPGIALHSLNRTPNGASRQGEVLRNMRLDFLHYTFAVWSWLLSLTSEGLSRSFRTL